jgi:hypothetical protein
MQILSVRLSPKSTQKWSSSMNGSGLATLLSGKLKTLKRWEGNRSLQNHDYGDTVSMMVLMMAKMSGNSRTTPSHSPSKAPSRKKLPSLDGMGWGWVKLQCSVFIADSPLP